MDGPVPIGARALAPLGDLRSAASARGALDARRAAEAGRVDEAAARFEALLATQLVKELRKGLSEGFFGSGAGADVFEGWFDEHLGSALAASGALDLASAVRIGLQQTRDAREREDGGPRP